LKNAGYSFAVPRAYKSTGAPDAAAPGTVANAWAAGFEHVDVYLFPCKAQAPAVAVDDCVSFLTSHSVKFGMLWFDIEGPVSQYWFPSAAQNIAWLQGAVAQAQKRGLTVGIYTSKSQWEPIMGTTTAFSSLPLWYPHYDGSPSFSDFSAFGGWTKPNIKQFRGDANLCSADVDENFY
jgi:GH25 family lysozyme M1 (1,4-beta-N-acetylmuramidase)